MDYLCEDLTSANVDNQKLQEAKGELKSVLNDLSLVDVANIITHHENVTFSAAGATRLKHFTEKLQKVLGNNHRICESLKNTQIYKAMKLNRHFKSQIVVDLDRASKPAGSQQEDTSSESDNYSEIREKTGNVEQALLFDSMLDEQIKKKNRSNRRKQRKNERQELNRAKRELINSLNL